MRKFISMILILALCLALTACGGEQGGDSKPTGGSEDGSGSGQENSSEVGNNSEPESRLEAENGSEPESTVGGDSAQPSEAVMDNQPTGPVAVGDDYRDFTAVLADGNTFTLSEHEGNVVLLNFWAAWCGPCVGEMPAFPMLLEKYGDDLTLVAVDLGEDAGTVESFLSRNGYEFPVVLDTDGSIGTLYPTDGIPYTVLIGRDGKIAFIHLGAAKADVMYESYCGEIDTLLEADQMQE